MSLADRIAAEQNAGSTRCFTCNWMRTLPEDAVDEIVTLKEDPTVTDVALWRAIEAEYAPKFTESAFGNHFRKSHPHPHRDA